MKKCFALLLCVLLLACKPPVADELPEPTSASEPATQNRVVEDWPVTEQIARLPGETESVDLPDTPLVYEADGTVYLYIRGVAIPLFCGTLNGSNAYDYIADAQKTMLWYIDGSDHTLYRRSLLAPKEPSVAIEPNVTRFAASEDGSVLLLLKTEPDGTEALYRYADGGSVRIEESVGEIDQFYLSPDGNSYIFYVWERPEGSDLPENDCLVLDNGEPIWLSEYVIYISEDLKTMLTFDEGWLKLYRDGKEPEILSTDCKGDYEVYLDGGICWWLDQENALWRYDGSEPRKVLENADVPRFTDKGAYAFFRGNALYAQAQGGAPVLLCTKERFGGCSFLEDGRTLLYETQDGNDAASWMHKTAYCVTVNTQGVSDPVCIAEDIYMVLPFRGEWIEVRTQDAKTFDLFFRGKRIAKDMDLWNELSYSDDARDTLLLASEGCLFRFDGETLAAILDPFPLVKRNLGDGTMVYLTGSRTDAGTALCRYDGTQTHRIADNVQAFRFIRTNADSADERLIHD